MNRCIGKAVSAMSKLSTRVWENTNLTTNTKIVVYSACVLSTLLLGSETWTVYAQLECHLNSFHLHCLRHILGISWQDRAPNKNVLECASILSMFAMLSQRRLCWLGPIQCTEHSSLPKHVLYAKLMSGSRPVGCPMLHYKDVCKRDKKSSEISLDSREVAVADHSNWSHMVCTGVRRAEARREEQWHNKREQQRTRAAVAPLQPTSYTCSNCNKDCLSRIGLYSHSRCCSIAN